MLAEYSVKKSKHKMGKYIYAFILLILLLYACNQNNTSVEEVAILPVAPEKLSSPEELFDFSDTKVITLETNKGNLLSDIRKVQIYDDKIFIQDESPILYVFDMDGYYLYKIDHLGQGPEEYIQLSDFDVFDSCVYICSKVEKKLKVYNLKGDYLITYNFDDDWYSNIQVQYPIVYLYSDYGSQKFKSLTIYNLDKEQVVAEYMPIEENQSYSVRRPPFVKNDNGTTLLVRVFDDNIYQLTDNIFEKKYQIDFKTEDQLPKNIYEIDFVELSRKMIGKKVVTRIDYPYIYKDKLYISYIYDFYRYMSKIDLIDGLSKTSLLYDENTFLAYSPTPLGFIDGYLISSVTPLNILKRDENFSSNKNKNGILSEDDNPVIFLQKLK